MRDRRTGLLLGGVCALVLLMACELNLPAPPGGADESIVLAPPGGVETPDEAQTAGGTEPEPPQGARGLVRFVLDQRLFVLLAILGLALCVVTGFGVFALIRRRPRRAKRQGRRGDKSSSLVEKTDQMPEGVVLGEGQYLVVRRLPVSAGASVYEVKATSPTPLCPRCWAPADDAAVQNACHRCGAPLGEALSAAPRLIAREALEPQTYAVSAELLTDQLAHPSVVTPIAVFADASFGELRYYQVEPLVEERLATTLDRPQSLDNVLDWGADLARGLAYLHDHGVVLDRVTLEQVIVQDGAVPNEGTPYAGWLCFDSVSLLSRGDGVDHVELEAANVRDLARMLLQLATTDDAPRKDDASQTDDAPQTDDASQTDDAPQKDDASQTDGASQTAEELPQSVKRTLLQAIRSHGLLRAGDFAVALERVHEQLAQRQAARLLVGKQTDVGHVRTLNEDSLWVMVPTASQPTRPAKGKELPSTSAISLGVFVVADGVGGHAAGDVASRLAVEAIADHGHDLQRPGVDDEVLVDTEAWLTRAAKAANQAVYAGRQAASNDMGCTLVMALVVGRAATVLNVGDSRAYRLNPQGIRQITTDHSLVQRLIDIGQLTPEEARHHPQKSVIYRVVGDAPELKMDLFDVVLSPGEALLLCSDGLSDMVIDDDIWRVWRETPSPQAACDQLVMLAKEAGGYDNITVVIVQIA